MRIVSGVFCVLLAIFALVQYNDPDALFWGLIYGVGALWCGLVAFRGQVFAIRSVRQMLNATVLAALFGVIWYWPRTPGFWHKDVWWETETAREGMGMMIVALALVVAWLAVQRERRRSMQ